MKYQTTYLANNGNGLEVITYQEWRSITESNKGKDVSERRYFITSEVDMGSYIDRMLIEDSYEKYLEWHAMQKRLKTTDVLGSGTVELLSLDDETNDSFAESLCCNNENTEKLALDNLLMDSLREALRAWKPWGEDMLDAFLCGKQRSCTTSLKKKYGACRQTVAEWKVNFQEFVKAFFSKGDI